MKELWNLVRDCQRFGFTSKATAKALAINTWCPKTMCRVYLSAIIAFGLLDRNQYQKQDFHEHLLFVLKSAKNGRSLHETAQELAPRIGRSQNRTRALLKGLEFFGVVSFDGWRKEKKRQIAELKSAPIIIDMRKMKKWRQPNPPLDARDVDLANEAIKKEIKGMINPLLSSEERFKRGIKVAPESCVVPVKVINDDKMIPHFIINPKVSE